jgi:hypothetical protein
MKRGLDAVFPSMDKSAEFRFQNLPDLGVQDKFWRCRSGTGSNRDFLNKTSEPRSCFRSSRSNSSSGRRRSSFGSTASTRPGTISITDGYSSRSRSPGWQWDLHAGLNALESGTNAHTVSFRRNTLHDYVIAFGSVALGPTGTGTRPSNGLDPERVIADGTMQVQEGCADRCAPATGTDSLLLDGGDGPMHQVTGDHPGVLEPA